MRAFWRIAGLLIGIALAVAALLAPQATLDGATTALGLDRLTPLAHPPLGHTARLALAAGGLILGLLLAFVLGRATRRTGPVVGEARPEMRYDPVTVRDSGSQTGALLPVIDPEPVAKTALHETYPAPAEPVATTITVAPTETAVAEPETMAIYEAAPAGLEPMPIVAATEPMLRVHEAAPTAPQPVAPFEVEPVYAGGPITVDPEPAPPAAPLAPTAPPYVAATAAPDPALAVTLARVEAAVADLAQHGPAHVGTRLDAIDARMGQLAQQIAELAGLARAAARTPAPAAAPTLATLRAPGDPARRHAVGAAARALRDRLDREG